MKEEFLEPTRATRIKLALAYIGYGALLLGMEFYWSPFMDYVKSLPSCQEIIWLQRISLFFGAFGIVTAFLCIRAAYWIFRSNQFPSPVAWIWNRAKIKRGMIVYVSGFVFIAMAFMMMSVFIFLWHFLDGETIFCINDSCNLLNCSEANP